MEALLDAVRFEVRNVPPDDDGHTIPLVSVIYLGWLETTDPNEPPCLALWVPEDGQWITTQREIASYLALFGPYLVGTPAGEDIDE